MAEEEGDFVFYGTPIEREEDTSARKRKAISDAGQLRSLPAWKQEVRDENGIRRFHGAFTGGYSAGYFNTVGSKEGWTPQTFTSSRKNRAEVKQQNINSFLDDEDIKGMGGHALETSSQFDTFGFTAAEVARKESDKEQQKRPSAIPGPAPDEIILPAANSIGMELLRKMGWRRGHAVKDIHADSYDKRREGRKAMIAFSGNKDESELSHAELSETTSEDVTAMNSDGLSKSTPVFVLYPKQDLHGLGYDPFKHAPEFRDRKRARDSRNKNQGIKPDVAASGKSLSSNSGKYAPGFGIGALEELDAEDEDIYASGFELGGTEIVEDEPSKEVQDKPRLQYRKLGVLLGFKIASTSDYNKERFEPPAIPPDFEPSHKFASPIGTVDKFAEPPPPEVPPPDDNSLRLLIDGFATLVVRCGKLFEDLSKEKNKSNPLFSFLNGGPGNSYYARKLWEAKQKGGNQKNLLDLNSVSSDRKMTAETRGRILGEKPLEKTFKDPAPSVTPRETIHLQTNLSDTFTQTATVVDFSERAKPFKDDPAKQERFEKFLKEKYQGGLRSTHSGGSASMSESARARERLDFEAAAEAIEKGNWNTNTTMTMTKQFMEFPGTGDSRFVPSTGVERQNISQDEEKMLAKIYPKREEFQWRPAPILCKRFDVIDPFMGKPPPVPRARSKMDSLIFMPDSLLNSKSAGPDAQQKETGKQPSTEEPENVPDATPLERPVDLYKAIFSDDSEEEVENTTANKADDLEKKTGGANTTLNLLVAGDFLESLGKELGLEVPPETPAPFINNTQSENSADKFHLPIANEPIDDKSKKGVSNGDDSSDHEERRDRRSRKHRSRSRHHRSSSTSDSDSSNREYYRDHRKSRSHARDSQKEKSRDRSRRHRNSSSSRRDSDRDSSDGDKEKSRDKLRRRRKSSSRRDSDRDFSDGDKERRSKEKKHSSHRKYR